MIWDVLYAAGGVVFSTLGGGALVLTLSSWLGKVWAARILEKDRKRYETELEGVRAQYRHEVEEKLQLLRDRLERGQFVHWLQFETEFTIYQDLWGKLVAARNAALKLRPFVDCIPHGKSPQQEQQERLESVAKAHDNFRQCYATNKPFVSPEVYEAINALGKAIHDEAIDYKYAGSQRGREYWEEAKKNAELIEIGTDSICEAIRKRIGVITVLPEMPNLPA